MNTPSTRGFTIIEVMLFLAVSGIMVAMLLGGWTLMINTQRYKDSIDTVYGYLQDQYGLVYNVENERGSNLTCTADGQIDDNGASTDTRGQSDCVLMGRYIQLTNGNTFRSYAVVGKEPATPVSGSDTEMIKSYNPKVVQDSIGLSEAEQVVPWGSVIKRPNSQSALQTTILLLRAPESGLVHRYIVDGMRVDPIIRDADLNQVRENAPSVFCFDAGTIVQGSRQSVVIQPYGSSRNSVETNGGSDSGC